METNLTARAGFDAHLDLDRLALRLGPGVILEKKVERRLPQVAEVLYDGAAETDDVIYFMNYDIRPADREETAATRPLRYDITVILPRIHGTEFNKTAGHYHPAPAGQRLSYPEIYEVISGEARYVLQRLDGAGQVADLILVDARAGDQVLIPPEYGHISINTGTEPLVMANLVARDCQPDYGPIRQMAGACCYTVSAGGAPQLVLNAKYGTVPAPRQVELRNLAAFGLGAQTPLFQRFDQAPERFRYLFEPDAARALFEQALGCAL